MSQIYYQGDIVKFNICEKNLSLYFYILYIGTFICIILIFHHVTLHGHKLEKVKYLRGDYLIFDFLEYNLIWLTCDLEKVTALVKYVWNTNVSTS